jgi:hypothetical protein
VGQLEGEDMLANHSLLFVRYLTVAVLCVSSLVHNREAQANDERFTIDTNLREVVNVSGVDLDRAIETVKPDNALIGLGQIFVDVGNKKGINAYYIAAHAAWETGWGTSAIFKDKNNLFGYGAFDRCPYECALTFETVADGVDYAMARIKEDYLTEGGKYYNGPTLRGMNIHYATDSNWAQGIATIMNSLYRNAVPLLSAQVVSQPNWPILIEGESLEIEINIENAGSETWTVDDCLMVNSKNPWGADEELRLPNEVKPGETATFSWTTEEFSKWGVYTTEWSMTKGEEAFNEPIKFSVIVLPKQLEEKRKELEEKVKEWSEEQIENIEELVIEWIQEQINETLKDICNPAAIVLPIAIAIVFSKSKKR